MHCDGLKYAGVGEFFLLRSSHPTSQKRDVGHPRLFEIKLWGTRYPTQAN